jgi:hypothetical protein
LAITFAAPLVYRAAHSLALEDPERAQHVSMAKAFASMPHSSPRARRCSCTARSGTRTNTTCTCG